MPVHVVRRVARCSEPPIVAASTKWTAGQRDDRPAARRSSGGMPGDDGAGNTCRTVVRRLRQLKNNRRTTESPLAARAWGRRAAKRFLGVRGRSGAPPFRRPAICWRRANVCEPKPLGWPYRGTNAGSRPALRPLRLLSTAVPDLGAENVGSQPSPDGRPTMIAAREATFPGRGLRSSGQRRRMLPTRQRSSGMPPRIGRIALVGAEIDAPPTAPNRSWAIHDGFRQVYPPD
jgi:hypothetical protein